VQKSYKNFRELILTVFTPTTTTKKNQNSKNPLFSKVSKFLDQISTKKSFVKNLLPTASPTISLGHQNWKPVNSTTAALKFNELKKGI
jgi:hypothetical protein